MFLFIYCLTISALVPKNSSRKHDNCTRFWFIDCVLESDLNSGLLAELYRSLGPYTMAMTAKMSLCFFLVCFSVDDHLLLLTCIETDKFF